jgi:hypothetical protein
MVISPQARARLPWGQGVQFPRGKRAAALQDGPQQGHGVAAQREPGAGVIGVDVVGLRGRAYRHGIFGGAL